MVARLRAFYDSPPDQRGEFVNTPQPKSSRTPLDGAGGAGNEWFTPPAGGVTPVGPPAGQRSSCDLLSQSRAGLETSLIGPTGLDESAAFSGRSLRRTPPQNTSGACPAQLITLSSPEASANRTPLVTLPVIGPPAVLTTTTVTTTMAGSPVMSTGFPGAGGGRGGTPPPPPPLRSPPTVPVALESAPRTTTGLGAIPKRILRPRRQQVAPPPPSPSGTEGEEEGSDGSDEAWVLQCSRTERRRARRTRRGESTTESEDGVARASPSPPPLTSANYPPLRARGTTTRAGEGGGRTLPAGRPEETAVTSIGESHALHPSVSHDIRGVMGRRRVPAGSAGAPAPAPGAGPRARPPATRPRPPAAAGPPRGAPAAAPVVEIRPARQRAAERLRLVALAEAAATSADLEDLATQVVEFFGGRRQDGGARRPRDRAGRSRDAGDRGARARGVAGARGDARNRGDAPASVPFTPQGEGGGNQRDREAARIQALFRMNRRKAVREILAGPSEVCDLPTEVVQRYFEDTYCGAGILEDVARPAERSRASSESEDTAGLIGPFGEREVTQRLKRMSNSAPGPDGITYRDLRERDNGARLLAAVFNACLRLEEIPATWKTSNTVLIHKKGDRDKLENWRPLALGDTLPKLFAALLADRLTDWAIDSRVLSPSQKGFLRDEGCYEHNFVLQEILTDARRSGREAVVAWLDLSNAFGSVPHAAIRRALVRVGVPRGLIAIWDSMYNGCTTRVRTRDGFTAPIHVRSGVRQGCPLSPIVFDLVIDSVLRAVTDLGPGCELMGSRWSCMAYADDLVLVTRTPADMERLLAVAEDEASSVGLRFNPAKCATLHVVGGKGGGVLPTTLAIQGQLMRPLAEGDSYEHLGIPTGSSVNQTPHATLQALSEDLRSVDRSLLAPWQKSEAVATFLLPRLDFLLRGARVDKRPLTAIDLQIRRLCKTWLNLPQRASAEIVYIPPRKGGCGLLPLADLADVLSIAHVFRLLTAEDQAIKDLAWASLRGVVQRRIRYPPARDDIAGFLSGSLESKFRGGGELSVWSSARNAARRQSDRCAIRWLWCCERDELTLECRGPRGRITKIPPGARAQVIGRLRSAVAEWYEYTLVAKPDQGKVFEVSSRGKVSNHFLRGGSFTRFADWRFIHRARLDVLPLNGTRRWERDGDKRCRRCGAESETLPHVLCHCGPHSAAVQWRHDSVLLRLKRAHRLPGETTVNQRVRGIDGELGELRPDLVIRHEPSKSVVICDVTVPFENRWQAFEEARERKLAKYASLAEALQRQGYRVVVTAFVVGALGSWDPRNEPVLKLLRVSKAYATMMRRLIVSDAIRWSRDIYVEHVSGIRQYEAPPRPEHGGCPDVSPPRAVRRRVTEAHADGGVGGRG